MSNEDLGQRVAAVEAQVESSKNDFTDFKEDARDRRAEVNNSLKDIIGQLQEIKATLDKAKGGWRVALLIGTAIATLVGIVTGIIAAIKNLG